MLDKLMILFMFFGSANSFIGYSFFTLNRLVTFYKIYHDRSINALKNV